MGRHETYKLLLIYKTLSTKFQCNLKSTYVETLWNTIPTLDKESDLYKEIYTLCVMLNPKNSLTIQSFPPNELAQFAMFYKTTLEQLSLFLEHKDNQVFRSLSSYIIKNKYHDTLPSLNGIMDKLDLFIDYAGVSRKEVLDFLEDWGCIDIPEKLKQNLSSDLIKKTEWFASMLETNTSFGKVCLDKVIKELYSQAKAQFFSSGLSHIGSYWDKVLTILAPTDKIKLTDSVALKEIAVELLDRKAKGVNDTDETLVALSKKINYHDFTSEIRAVAMKFINHVPEYVMSPDIFLNFHAWFKELGIYKSYIGNTADYILAPIINNSGCQKTILKDKTFYTSLLVEGYDQSTLLQDAIKKVATGNDDMALYIREILPQAISQEKKEQ